MPVIKAYAEALRMSVVTAVAASAILLVLLLPVKLPKLKGKVEAVGAGE
jgi:hypothetical protein